MKTKIDKFDVEKQLIQKLKNRRFDKTHNIDLIACDYIDILRNEMIDKYNARDIYVLSNERLFVAIECETQIEFVFVYNETYNEITHLFQRLSNSHLIYI